MKKIKIRKIPIPVFAAILSLLAVIFLVFLFYYSGFRTLNGLITEANKGISGIAADPAVISKENLEKITFVKVPEQDTFYVNGSCFPFVKKIGITKLEFQCTAAYKVYDPYQDLVIQEVEQQKFQVKMQFLNWKWVVTEVTMNQ